MTPGSTAALVTVACNVIGAGLMVAGWVGVSGRGTWDGQLSSFNVAVLGLLLATVANAVLVLRRWAAVEHRAAVILTSRPRVEELR